MVGLKKKRSKSPTRREKSRSKSPSPKKTEEPTAIEESSSKEEDSTDAGLVARRRDSLFALGVKSGVTKSSSRRKSAAPRRRKSRKQARRSVSFDLPTTTNNNSEDSAAADAAAKLSFEMSVKEAQKEVALANYQAEMKMKRRASLTKRQQEFHLASPLTSPTNEKQLRASTGTTSNPSPTASPDQDIAQGLVKRRQSLFNIGLSPTSNPRNSRRRDSLTNGTASPGTIIRRRRASQMVITRQQELTQKLTKEERVKRQLSGESMQALKAAAARHQGSLRSKIKRRKSIDMETESTHSEPRGLSDSSGTNSNSHSHSSGDENTPSEAASFGFGDSTGRQLFEPPSLPAIGEDPSASLDDEEPHLSSVSVDSTDTNRKRNSPRTLFTKAANLFQTKEEPEEEKRPSKRRVSLEEKDIETLVKKEFHQRMTEKLNKAKESTASSPKSSSSSSGKGRIKAIQKVFAKASGFSFVQPKTKTKTRKKWFKRSTKKASSKSTKPTLSQEEAALRIHKFMKESTSILAWYRDETTYWNDEQSDIARRQKEEMDEVQLYIEIEKQKFRLELLQEQEEEGEASPVSKEAEEVKQQLLAEQEEYKRLEELIRQLTQENRKLARGNPREVFERPAWEQKVSVLHQEQSKWKFILKDLTKAKHDVQQRIDLVLEKTKTEQKETKKLEDCIESVHERAKGASPDKEEIEKEVEQRDPLETTKVTMPTLVEEATGSADDFTSGRKDQFEDIYEIGKKLGEGAFGAVHVCTHKTTGAERAVKIITKSWMSEWEIEDVIKEFEMLHSFDNPNVIRVYEFYDTEEVFYMVQELAQGGELFDELERHGKLKEDDVALLMKHILHCTDYLAQNNIVHRDLNLENILLQEPGNYDSVKLIDFGLAAKCEEGDKLFDMVGKARYLAPEVLGDDGYGLGYDVWSCGIVAAVLLTGYFPFEADSDMDVYHQIVQGAYINYDGEDWIGISDQAKDFVRKLLTFEDSTRPTAADGLQHPWITGSTGDSPATADVWVAPKREVVSVFESHPQSDWAARKIQQFLRKSAEILAWHKEDMTFWLDEQKDIERRRQEELEACKRFVEVKKQQFQLRLYHETEDEDCNDSTGGECLFSCGSVENLEADLVAAKDEHSNLRESIRKLHRGNKRLVRDNTDREKSIEELQEELAYLGEEQTQLWEGLTILEATKNELGRRVGKLEQATQKRAVRKIQRFLSEASDILASYREEYTCLLDEKQDVERRRKEELADVEIFLELENKLARLMLETEDSECPIEGSELQKLKLNFRSEMDNQQQLKAAIRNLSLEGKRLARQNPANAKLVARLAALEGDQGELLREQGAVLQQIDDLQLKRDAQLRKLRILRSWITRIADFVDPHLVSEDPKLGTHIAAIHKTVLKLTEMQMKAEQRRARKNSIGNLGSMGSMGSMGARRRSRNNSIGSIESIGSASTSSTCSDSSSSSREDEQERGKNENMPYSWRKHAMKRQQSAPNLFSEETSRSTNRKGSSLTADNATKHSKDKRGARPALVKKQSYSWRHHMKHMNSEPRISIGMEEEEEEEEPKPRKKTGSKKNSKSTCRRSQFLRTNSTPLMDIISGEEEKTKTKVKVKVKGKNRRKDMSRALSSPMLEITSDEKKKVKNDTKRASRPALEKTPSYSWRNHRKEMNSAPLLDALNDGSASSHDDSIFLVSKSSAKATKSSATAKKKDLGEVDEDDDDRSLAWSDDQESSVVGGKDDEASYAWGSHLDLMSSGPLLNKDGTKSNHASIASLSQLEMSAPNLSVNADGADKKKKRRKSPKGGKAENALRRSGTAPSRSLSPKGSKRPPTKAKMKSEGYAWKEHADFMESAPMLSLSNSNSDLSTEKDKIMEKRKRRVGRSISAKSDRSDSSSQKAKSKSRSPKRALAIPRVRSLNAAGSRKALADEAATVDRPTRGVTRVLSLDVVEAGDMKGAIAKAQEKHRQRRRSKSKSPGPEMELKRSSTAPQRIDTMLAASRRKRRGSEDKSGNKANYSWGDHLDASEKSMDDRSNKSATRKKKSLGRKKVADSPDLS